MTSARAKHPVPLLLAPLPGHSEDEVLRLLASAGATEVTTRASGPISALVRLDRLRDLRGVARLHVQAPEPRQRS